MQNNSPKLLIEINNVELIFVVIERNDNDRFSLLYSQKIPNEGVSEKRITDFNLFLRLIRENIYLIEKKLDYIFKEVILIIDNFNCSLISFSGFKKLNGSQLGKENVTYILNNLKSKLLEIEKDKTILHIFNSNFLLDKKKINNLPIGLFGDFYSHELSFFLIDSNDFKNLNKVFEKCNLKIKKIISKDFILGTKIINDNINLETFLKIEINEDNINLTFFENSTIRFFQKFKFGANLILNDISKVTALENRILKNILLKSKFSAENERNNFIEEEFFGNQKFRKIKKQLVYDIATARIQEISEIIAFKNINIKSFLNKNLKIFLQINEECNLKSFEKIYKNIFSNNKYELNLINNYDQDQVYENALSIVQYGWKKEAVPIIYEKKSLIRRVFDLFFN